MSVGTDGDLESRLIVLARRIEHLEEQLRKERTLTEELARELHILRGIVQTSGNIVGISRRIALLSESLRSGEVARAIVEALFDLGPMNISQLAEVLRRRRGKASRRTVSRKIEELSERGLVEPAEGKRSEKLFRLKDGRR